jgi:DNA polymerase III alpha subunit
MIPLFKSHYSICKSILTLDADHEESGPRSIPKLCADYGIEKPFLIDDNMSGFPEAYKNFATNNIDFRFGLRLTVCEDMADKNENSIKTEHKIVVMMNSGGAYEKMVKIASESATNGLYYIPRIDFKTLKKYWSKDLTLIIPFYDSYFYNNLISWNQCVPEYFTDFYYFSEDNGTLINAQIKESLKEHVKKNKKGQIIEAKSIYYEKKDDFLAYLTLRCIGKRTTLQKPNLDGMCSDEFCLESWEEKNGR